MTKKWLPMNKFAELKLPKNTGKLMILIQLIVYTIAVTKKPTFWKIERQKLKFMDMIK